MLWQATFENWDVVPGFAAVQKAFTRALPIAQNITIIVSQNVISYDLSLQYNIL